MNNSYIEVVSYYYYAYYHYPTVKLGDFGMLKIR